MEADPLQLPASVGPLKDEGTGNGLRSDGRTGIVGEAHGGIEVADGENDFGDCGALAHVGIVPVRGEVSRVGRKNFQSFREGRRDDGPRPVIVEELLDAHVHQFLHVRVPAEDVFGRLRLLVFHVQHREREIGHGADVVGNERDRPVLVAVFPQCIDHEFHRERHGELALTCENLDIRERVDGIELVEVVTNGKAICVEGARGAGEVDVVVGGDGGLHAIIVPNRADTSRDIQRNKSERFFP